MTERLQQSFDVLVVGGGPAGIAAAVHAAEAGVCVGLVDENVTMGGQIWRGEFENGHTRSESSQWHARFKSCGAIALNGHRVFHQPEPGILLAESLSGLSQLSFRHLILATGARERFLPFPGWTLPNVLGAGGLQALVKSGLPIRGKRVVVAGTGPLLLAVASYLRKHGAEIPMICEQASWAKLAQFGLHVTRFPHKIGQSLRLKRDISGIRFAANSWPLEAHGKNVIEAVTICRGGTRQTLDCDFLACGFHLVPNSELPALLGCRTRNGYVQVNDLQQTSVPGIYCAGEPTGIGGVDLAVIEGQIAGLSAAGKNSDAQQLFGKRAKLDRFAGALAETFCLRSELKTLPAPETLICRCEDVSFTRLQKHTSWREAKLHTRCGMGPCQGRVCGPATQFLFKWNPDSVRPPVFPARVENLALAPTAPQSIPVVTGELQ